MPKTYIKREYQVIAEFIQERTKHRPTIGIVLGSGLSALADEVREADKLPYRDIPRFPTSKVEGHGNRLVIGLLEEVPVIVMQGRIHFYEGYSMVDVTLPTRVLREFGVKTLIITNAAGGINPDFAPGELMLITDHINLAGMVGHNPLMGANDPELGERFPDMSEAYDAKLRATALQVAEEEEIPLQQGVYIMLSGPNFETPAEVEFIRRIGADAVGMSTVPEVIVARHGGMRVLGISGITNIAGATASNHQEVLDIGAVITPRMVKLIKGILQKLPKGA